MMNNEVDVISVKDLAMRVVVVVFAVGMSRGATEVRVAVEVALALLKGTCIPISRDRKWINIRSALCCLPVCHPPLVAILPLPSSSSFVALLAANDTDDTDGFPSISCNIVGSDENHLRIRRLRTRTSRYAGVVDNDTLDEAALSEYGSQI